MKVLHSGTPGTCLRREQAWWGFPLVSPAEGTSALAQAHFNQLHACACMDRHARTTLRPHHHHHHLRCSSWMCCGSVIGGWLGRVSTTLHLHAPYITYSTSTSFVCFFCLTHPFSCVGASPSTHASLWSSFVRRCPERWILSCARHAREKQFQRQAADLSDTLYW